MPVAMTVQLEAHRPYPVFRTILKPVIVMHREVKSHDDRAGRVMRLLASAGVFTEAENDNFALTPVGECLRTGVPGSSRAMVMLFAGNRIQESWKDLEYCVRTGEPAYRRRGVTDPFLDPLRTPE
jgi:hypothetical protein